MPFIAVQQNWFWLMSYHSFGTTWKKSVVKMMFGDKNVFFKSARFIALLLALKNKLTYKPIAPHKREHQSIFGHTNVHFVFRQHTVVD